MANYWRELMNSIKKENTSYYPIGAVARLTGITVHTLRVWEQRYKAIEAERTDSGRRQYNSHDVDRLMNLKFLVDRGCQISSIASLVQDELDKLLKEYNNQKSLSNIVRKKDKPSVAIFGEYLPIKIKKINCNLDDFAIVFCGSDMNSFKADARRIKPDIIILELAVVDEHVLRLVEELRRITNSRRIIIIYSYARSADIKRINDGITSTMKAPVALEELFNIISLLNTPTPINNKPKIEIRSKQPTEFTAPAKRFSRNTLAVLGDVASNITCECPHHLTELVIGLSNFEDYSAECVSKSPDDAELHAYLQSTTAKCRASMEEALEKVAIAEGIDFKTLG